MSLNKILTFSAVLFYALWLSGCHQPSHYQYLMSHPKQLKSAVSRCQTLSVQSSACDVVQRAADDFAVLANKRLANPDVFGQQIMQAELQLANTLQEFNQLKHDVNHSNNTDVQKKLAFAEQAYQAQLEKVQTLLAVVVATSPGDLS